MAQAKPKDSKGTFFKRLHEMPQAVGIVLMLLLMVAALYVGNARAFSAIVSDAASEVDLTGALQERLGAVANMLTIARREDYAVDPDRIAALDRARANLQKASGLPVISRADQTLYDEMTLMNSAMRQEPGLTAADQKNLQSVMASFHEAENIIRQQVRGYNQKLDKALETYERLPFRFLLPEPQKYEFPTTTSEATPRVGKGEVQFA